MLKKFFNQLKKKFEHLRAVYLEVIVDRLIFEPEINRYLMVFKSKGSFSRSFVVPIQPSRVEFESDSLFFEMNRLVNFIGRLGFEFIGIRVDEPFVHSEPAEVLLRKGVFRKRVRISLVEAIYLNIENGIPVKVRSDLFNARQEEVVLKAGREVEPLEMLFSARVYENEFKINEVIM